MERSLRPWAALWGETILVTHLQEFLTGPSSSEKKDGTYYIINYILNALFVVLFFKNSIGVAYKIFPAQVFAFSYDSALSVP